MNVVSNEHNDGDHNNNNNHVNSYEEVVLDPIGVDDHVGVVIQQQEPRTNDNSRRNILRNNNSNNSNSNNNNNTVHYTPAGIVEIIDVPWVTQMKYTMKKNMLLISRNPIMLFIMLFSSIFSVLLTRLATRKQEVDATDFPPVGECGVIDYGYYMNLTVEEQNDLPVTMNDAWAGGTPVVYMSLGPFAFACCVYLIVHEEISLNLYEVLRGLSVRDSVYWISWYLSFAMIALVNSLAGSITAKIVTIHVMKNTYFGGIFASLLLLQLSLCSASLFLSAVVGNRKKSTSFIIMIMFIAVWVPRIYTFVKIPFPLNDGYGLSSAILYNNDESPGALYWINRDTTSIDPNTYTSTCTIPIMSQAQGQFLKTEEEQKQVGDDEFYVGCYVSAGMVNLAWDMEGVDPQWKFLRIVTLYTNPYFQFTLIWGNFLGMTSLPNNEFHIQHSSMSPEELAIKANVDKIVPNNNITTDATLFPSGSSIRKISPYEFSNENAACYSAPCSNCPDQNRTGFDFCDRYSSCPYAESSQPITTGKSVQQLLSQLLLQSILFLTVAAYIGIACIGGGSEVNSWYFPFKPSYWFPRRKRKKQQQHQPQLVVQAPNTTAMNDDESPAAHGNNEETMNSDFTNSVIIQSVTKVYGSNEAVKNVSMHLREGEVTALLGHNGAGKTTLSHILCCEHKASQGDATVFGFSVTHDPQSVRKLIGVCKQDNYLWPNLSAKEHLELFAGLRGIDSMEAPSIIAKWLESVDLDSVMHQFSSSYSGGMKRRLSLSLATIGNTQKFIILDEPTTGMDPVSRRFVWRHIDEVKHDRVILLTTHAMEEADLLADMVAIMKNGQVVALGSPMELKCEHGTALQFNVLVEKREVDNAVTRIREHFQLDSQWVEVKSSEAGNLTVTIKKVKESGTETGIDVKVLTDFVKWLESDTSNVSEFGFSNSSLEEVYLKVTDGEVEYEESDVVAEPTLDDEVAAAASAAADTNGRLRIITSYKATLKRNLQIRALVMHFIRLNWMGSRSISSWILYGSLIALAVLIGCRFPLWILSSGSYNFIIMVIPVLLISPILINVTSTLYWDRNEGLLYHMQSHGMLDNAYLGGIGVYSVLVYFVYSFIMMTLFFVSPAFREAELCSYTNGTSCERGFFDPPRIDMSSVQSIDVEGGTVFAYMVPSGYANVYAIILAFAFTGPGAVLSSSFLPGNKFALAMIGFGILIACIAPFAIYLSVSVDDIEPCTNKICDFSKGLNNTDDILNCLGVEMSDSIGLCIPIVASLLPQVGVFQLLGLSFNSRIKFVSQPSNLVTDVFLPTLKGANCDGNVCDFPYADGLFWRNWFMMLLGGFCLLIIGLASARFYDLAKQFITRLEEMLNSSRSGATSTSVVLAGDQDEEELNEVTEERRLVTELVQPLLAESVVVDNEDNVCDNNVLLIRDHSTLPRDELPPILTHRLRKVYPSLGGLPPKIALSSLDLHVPKGQVLGLLGKNGAGKTTALKILSNAHKATSGIALVGGYDTFCEKLAVFERLGNCAQFDVVWPTLSVKEHLEFFARLKGLNKADAINAALEVARAVGLGAEIIYWRQAKRLSGGMRRRLSLASALICSPPVFLLDEPTTGLDPSTRNSIWNLVSSIASENRSVIITTHMMIEADTLCDRIAIVSKGKLRVVATPQYLKDIYGAGYLLQINLVKSTVENQDIAMNFVCNYIHKDAVLQTKQAKTMRINLPRDLDLEVVFGALYNSEVRPDSINQFLLSQSSLEDVFVALGE